MATHRLELTEDQWQRIQALLPSDQARGSFQPLPNREVVNAIVWILRSGAPWRDLPERFPNWKSVHTRFLRWSKAGIWNRAFEAMAVHADDEVAIIDASIVRVHMDAVGGKKTAANRLDDHAAARQRRSMLSWTALGTRRKLHLPKGKFTT